MTTLLNGGRDIAVPLPDGSNQSVRIYQVRLSEIKAYADAYLVNDEAALVRFYTRNKDDAFGDTLTATAVEAILQTGEEVNADFFASWRKRCRQRQEVLLPGATAAADATVSRLLESVSGKGEPEAPKA